MKVSGAGPDQYYGGGPCGKPFLFFFPRLNPCVARPKSSSGASLTNANDRYSIVYSWGATWEGRVLLLVCFQGLFAHNKRARAAAPHNS